MPEEAGALKKILSLCAIAMLILAWNFAATSTLGAKGDHTTTVVLQCGQWAHANVDINLTHDGEVIWSHNFNCNRTAKRMAVTAVTNETPNDWSFNGFWAIGFQTPEDISGDGESFPLRLRYRSVSFGWVKIFIHKPKAW